jgi:hypothetical protein
MRSNTFCPDPQQSEEPGGAKRCQKTHRPSFHTVSRTSEHRLLALWSVLGAEPHGDSMVMAAHLVLRFNARASVAPTGSSFAG